VVLGFDGGGEAGGCSGGFADLCLLVKGKLGGAGGRSVPLPWPAWVSNTAPGQHWIWTGSSWPKLGVASPQGGRFRGGLGMSTTAQREVGAPATALGVGGRVWGRKDEFGACSGVRRSCGRRKARLGDPQPGSGPSTSLLPPPRWDALRDPGRDWGCDAGLSPTWGGCWGSFVTQPGGGWSPATGEVWDGCEPLGLGDQLRVPLAASGAWEVGAEIYFFT